MSEAKIYMYNSYTLPTCMRNIISSCPGDKPSLVTLKKFPGQSGNFNVLERIGQNYNDFGTFLLQDDDGTKVSAIEAERLRNCPSICEDIVKKWLQGQGEQPVTYAVLVQCLRDAKLHTLADDIEGVLQ